ncbi:hypothetical protein FRC00_004072 [Tulasnella sp. 408]|nr:hypothetical protein FRC00_004072 [Tulasnella sp. 408]
MATGQSKYTGTAETRDEDRLSRRTGGEIPTGPCRCRPSRSTGLQGSTRFLRWSQSSCSAIPFEPAQALSRINSATFNPLVATAELFSAFTRVHDSIKQTQLQVVIDNWNEVVKTEGWAIAKEKGKTQPYVSRALFSCPNETADENSTANRDQYYASVLCEILEASLLEEVYETYRKMLNVCALFLFIEPHWSRYSVFGWIEYVRCCTYLVHGHYVILCCLCKAAAIGSVTCFLAGRYRMEF